MEHIRMNLVGFFFNPQKQEQVKGT